MDYIFNWCIFNHDRSNIHDKNHSSKIEVVVDPSLSKNVISEEKKENLKIFVYNSQTNKIDETEVEIPEKKN